MTDTITINGRDYRIEKVLKHANAKYAAILRGKRGGRIHYEIRHNGTWFALAGLGTRNVRIIAEG